MHGLPRCGDQSAQSAGPAGRDSRARYHWALHLLRALLVSLTSLLLVSSAEAQVPTPTPPVVPTPGSAPVPTPAPIQCGWPGSGCRVVCEEPTPTPAFGPTWTPLPMGTPTLTPTVTPTPSPTPTPRPVLTESFAIRLVVVTAGAATYNIDISSAEPVWGPVSGMCGSYACDTYYIPISVTSPVNVFVRYNSSAFHWPRVSASLVWARYDVSLGWQLVRRSPVSVQVSTAFWDTRTVLTASNCDRFSLPVNWVPDAQQSLLTRVWYHQPGNPVYCWSDPMFESLPYDVYGQASRSWVLSIPSYDYFDKSLFQYNPDASNPRASSGNMAFAFSLSSYVPYPPTPTPTPVPSPTPTPTPGPLWSVRFDVPAGASCTLGGDPVPCSSSWMSVSPALVGASWSGGGTGSIWVWNQGAARGSISVRASTSGVNPQACVPGGCYPASSFSWSLSVDPGQPVQAIQLSYTSPSGGDVGNVFVDLRGGGGGGGGNVSPTPTPTRWVFPGCENLPAGCRCVFDPPKIEPVPLVDCLWLLPPVDVPGLGRTPSLRVCFQRYVVRFPWFQLITGVDLNDVLGVLSVIAGFYVVFRVVIRGG